MEDLHDGLERRLGRRSSDRRILRLCRQSNRAGAAVTPNGQRRRPAEATALIDVWSGLIGEGVTDLDIDEALNGNSILVSSRSNVATPWRQIHQWTTCISRRVPGGTSKVISSLRVARRR